MYTLNKFTLLIVLIFFAIGCSNKKIIYEQKIDAPLSNNTLAFDLYAYKQDTSMVIATSKGTVIKIDPNTLNERLEYYPADHEGFKHVKRLDNIYFEKMLFKIL